MLTALALSLAAAGVAPPPAAPAPTPSAFGPPALCHPILIGEARSLPWDGDGGFDLDESYDTRALVSDTLDLLAGSGDSLVHMETLRRAAVYVRSAGTSSERAEDLARELIAGLRGALAVTRAREGATDAEEGLRWFGLGYLHGVLGQAGVAVEGAGDDALDRACALRPRDPVVYLGRSLARWSYGRDRAPLRDLDNAVRLADDREGRLRDNLLAVGARLLETRTHDELVRELRRAIG